MRAASRSGHSLTLSKHSGAAAGPGLGVLATAGAAAGILLGYRALRPRAYSFRGQVVVNLNHAH